MKKKLALLMAAIMTVAMVPMTAFAAATTDINAVDQVKTAVDAGFTSRVELSKDESATDLVGKVVAGKYNGAEVLDIELILSNATFTKAEDNNGDEYYVMEAGYEAPNASGIQYGSDGIWAVDVKNDTTAYVTISVSRFNNSTCILPIRATATDKGEVIALFSTNNTVFADVKEVIAIASEEEVVIESEGVVTFVEDSTNVKNLKDITIEGLVNNAIGDETGGTTITLKLKGNYEFCVENADNGYLQTVQADGTLGRLRFAEAVTLLNDDGSVVVGAGNSKPTDDEITIVLNNVTADQVTKIRLSGIAIRATKGCDVGDVATITVSSDTFEEKVKLEVAKMVEEAVTYTLEDDDLPVIWAGKDYSGFDEEQLGWTANDVDSANTLELAIEENTGDILNTSRKATFTFPDGIEVVQAIFDGVRDNSFRYEIDENVVTIWYYGEREESDATDMEVEFVLNAAPTFSGDVDVTLGGEFDDVSFTVATVKAPYTIEAKTSEVLIDYRYVPVNEIVITEAEEDLLEEDDVIVLAVEKMDFEDAGSYEVTSGDIEVDVTIDDAPDGLYENDNNTAYLFVTVTDESTEASTITISGLELYLDRTLPVGGYALQNVGGRFNSVGDPNNGEAINILWENSTNDDADAIDGYKYVPNQDNASTGLFKYDAVTVNDSYVEVVTAGRDQDDSSTTRKIVITIGATTMAVGTETVTLDTPAYINAENYTELPLRAVSEAFGATVGWDDASRTVTIMMGQRIVSMTIGSKTMYINGTPVAMNTAPEITNERTFVPVRDLANALGITKIDWNEASATVTLN